MISISSVTRWLRSRIARASGSGAAPAPTSSGWASPTSPAQPPASATAFAPGGPQFVQPDSTTCGSCTLIMAKMINTPAYGASIIGAEGDTDAIKARFDKAVLAMHDSTDGWTDDSGRWQLPWPKSLGTPPWAVARQMSAPGGSGVPGHEYSVRIADPLKPADDYTAITTAVDGGDIVPLFIGDEVIARHVVLVTTHTSDDGVSIYDPSCGEWVSASREAYVTGAIGVAGWNQPWFAIVPA